MACGVVVAGGLWFLIEKTAFGIRLRATVDNAAMADALGVRTQVVYAVSFAIAIGLAAFGGVVGAEFLPIEPYYALRYMVTFLVVVSVGGAGSIPGAVDRLPSARRRRYDRPLPDAGIRQFLLLRRRDRHRLRVPARVLRKGSVTCRWLRKRNRSRLLPSGTGRWLRDVIGIVAHRRRSAWRDTFSFPTISRF